MAISTNARQPTSLDELSQRQRQILELLQAGKVNKEIARELGISLGTVKQHVVALFKRLNVKNRAMAVSRGMERRSVPRDEPQSQVIDGQLERRPCVVLSLALPEDAEPREARLLHGFMGAIAFDHDALFLARTGNAGDIIFGIRRVSEHDVLTALRAVRQLDADMGRGGRMHASLTAGVAVASMLRHGGWSGEAVASATISTARALLDETPAGMLVLDEPVRDLMRAFGVGRGHDISVQLPLDEIERLVWTGERAAFAMVGRNVELDRIAKILQGVPGRLLLLAGETGMGKSRLCQEVADRYVAQGGHVYYYRCLPGERDDLQLFDTRVGGALGVDDVLARIPRAGDARMLLILDDMHLASEAKAASLLRAATGCVAAGHVVLISSRRRLEMPGAEAITLGRLAPQEIVRLVASVTGMPKPEQGAIVDVAAGVPLFAVEMARHTTDEIPLPLLVVVSARLDSLRLDRQLLQQVARRPDGIDEAGLSAAMVNRHLTDWQPELEKAMAGGVIARRADGRFVVSHPLLRRVIDYMVVE